VEVRKGGGVKGWKFGDVEEQRVGRKEVWMGRWVLKVEVRKGGGVKG